VIRRDLVWLTVLALVVRLVTAAFIRQPGYMDTAYYAAEAAHLAEGGGLTEPFLWNYLDDPVGLPHPGFLYWMPLPSFLAVPFVALFPGSFFAAQLPFVLLSALLPPVAYLVAWQTPGPKAGLGARRRAWAACLLTLFSGFFFPYWTLPETFAPFALFGSLALWIAGGGKPDADGRMRKLCRWLLVGLLAGLCHLTRADGIVLLSVVALAPLLGLWARIRVKIEQDGVSGQAQGNAPTRLIASTIGGLALIVAGYLLVMGPWFLRNLRQVGSLLSPAGTKAMWLTTYDDLFCYDCDLSLRSYMAWGVGNVLRSKLFALWTNLQRFLAEDCLVFLLPLVLIGLYRLRTCLRFALSTIYLLCLYLVHSLVFTYPGWRGGFFHSSGVLLPYLYAAGIVGLDVAVRWVARRRRRWHVRQAGTVYAAGAVVLAVFLSLYVTFTKLPAWWDADQVYGDVSAWLSQRGVASDTAIMVGNPPAFWYRSRRPSVVVPNGGVDTLLAVADRYGVGYVILDVNRPVPLADLHAGQASHPRLQLAATWMDRETVLYAVRQER